MTHKVDMSFNSNTINLPGLFRLYPGIKNGPAPGDHLFFIGIWGKTFKIFLCEIRRHGPLIFGKSLYQSHILCEVSN